MATELSFPAPPPHEDLRGSEWGREEVAELLEWCCQKEQRAYILLRICARLQSGKTLHRARYRVRKEDLEDHWSAFCEQLWTTVCNGACLVMQKYDPTAEGSLIEYLVACAANSAATVERTETRRSAVRARIVEAATATARATGGPDESLCYRDAEAATALIEALPEDQARVVRMSADGWKVVEIAEHLKLCRSTVSSHKRRGLARLAQILRRPRSPES